MNNNFYLCTFSSVLLFGGGKEHREWDSKMDHYRADSIDWMVTLTRW